MEKDPRISESTMRSLCSQGSMTEMDRAFVNTTRDATTAALKKIMDPDDEDGPCALRMSDSVRLRNAYKTRHTVAAKTRRGETCSEALLRCFRNAGRAIARLDTRRRKLRAMAFARKLLRMAATDPKRNAYEMHQSG